MEKEPKKEEKVIKPTRQILIETDGDSINLVKAEVGGRLELVAILESLLRYLTTQQPNGTENKSK